MFFPNGFALVHSFLFIYGPKMKWILVKLFAWFRHTSKVHVTVSLPTFLGSCVGLFSWLQLFFLFDYPALRALINPDSSLVGLLGWQSSIYQVFNMAAFLILEPRILAKLEQSSYVFCGYDYQLLIQASWIY